MSPSPPASGDRAQATSAPSPLNPAAARAQDVLAERDGSKGHRFLTAKPVLQRARSGHGEVRVALRLRPCEASLIASHEIAEEFFSNSRRLDDAQRAWVTAHGVSASAIESDPYSSSGPLRFASVVFGEQYFDFVTDDCASAVPAFIVIARDQFGVTDDLVAFDGRGHLAPALGRARLLGEQMILAPRLDEPLRIFEDVWAWLRGNRDGVVILDWESAARRLENVPLAVDDIEFGQILRARLARPAPSIFVRIREAA
jgi:hypothetical protein